MKKYKIFASFSFSGQKVFLNNKEMKIINIFFFITKLKYYINYKELSDYISHNNSILTILSLFPDSPNCKSPIYKNIIDNEYNRYLNVFNNKSDLSIILNILILFFIQSKWI